MATATLMSPAAAYHPHNTSYPPSFSHPAPPPQPAIPTMISPSESRRASYEGESAPPRQSLPSISEVFSSTKASPYSPTTPTMAGGPQRISGPPPFTTAQPRAEPPPDNRQAPLHEDRFFRYPSRSEPASAGPSSAGFSYGDPRDLPKPSETMSRSIGPSNPSTQVPYAQSRPLPPGQYPLSAAPPISPSPLGPPGTPYDAQRPPLHSDEDYGMPRRYDTNALNRHFEAWNYSDCLQKIAWTARTIACFAENYANIASEQHGGHPIPERLPQDREVTEMLSNVEYLKKSVENVRELVQHSIATEKARDGGKQKGMYDDDDGSLYGDAINKHYGLGEVKKRRGRAAPPGRCHSCNRIDTPEWRRGPDGARTLCNACGLHYAKLERKRQMEQRSIRPKTGE